MKTTSRTTTRDTRRRTIATLVGVLVLAGGAGNAGAASGPYPTTAADEPEPVEATYRDIVDNLRDGNIVEAQFHPQDNVLRVELVDGTVLQSPYPAAQAPALVVSMLDSGIDVSSLPEPDTDAYPFGGQPLDAAPTAATVDPNTDTENPTRGSFLQGSTLLLLTIPAAFLILFWRGKRKERARAEREKASEPVPETTTFSDVAGCEEAIDDLREFVEFLRNPERFERLGAKIPRGALLVGPPGTGKTLLARAVAGEAGVAFHHAAGSDFVELYVGVGAQRVRELFAKARDSGRAIVFIDEIDAIGRVRSNAPGAVSGGHIEQENTLIALLNELDGFTRSGVIVLAATNRADILDPALTRPGRLERKIHVPNPDRRGRERILAVHTSDKPLADDVDLAILARRTPGMSGAELAHIANEAAIGAARKDLDRITGACFDEAIATVAMGRARHSALVTDADRRITAWHEAGHALVAFLEPLADDPVAVSIVPRGAAGGVTWLAGNDDQYLSRQAAQARLVVALGGRAGEELLLDGEFTQGAQGDLMQATALAEQMVTRYGMTRRGLMTRNVDEDAADVIEELLDEAMNRARELLQTHQTTLQRLARALLEHQTLTGPDLVAVIDGTATGPRTATLPQARATKRAPEATTAKRTRADHEGIRDEMAGRRAVSLRARVLTRLRRRREQRRQPT